MLADRHLAERRSSSLSCAIVKDVGLCSAAARSNTEALYLGIPENEFRCPVWNDDAVDGSLRDLSPHLGLPRQNFWVSPGYHRPAYSRSECRTLGVSNLWNSKG